MAVTGERVILAVLIIMLAVVAALGILTAAHAERCYTAVRIEDQAEELTDRILALSVSNQATPEEREAAARELHALLLDADVLNAQLEVATAACLGRPVKIERTRPVTHQEV